MFKFPDGSYKHRGMYIERDEIGIIITGGPMAREFVYPTIKDAALHIDIIKGRGKGKKPRIVGKWLELALAHDQNNKVKI